MSDTSKPPERVWAVRLRDGSWRLTKYHDPATVHATYTLASSLPGSVEEIEELVAAAQAVHDSKHIDPTNSEGQVELIRLNIALATMKPKEEKP